MPSETSPPTGPDSRSAVRSRAPARSRGRPADRRGQIRDAALGLFLAKGYRGTTLADIRRASGATTGSIYHFYAGKAGLALALVDLAVAGWSDAGGTKVDQPLDQAIRASVCGLVSWGIANSRLFRVFDELRALSDPDLGPVRQRIAAGQSTARSLYEQATREGLVTPLPWTLAHALMLGPAYDLLRAVAAGDPAPPDAADRLAEAAWQAVAAPT
jgi:AcrR family transcriptional regulator